MVDNMSTLNTFRGTPSKVNPKEQAFDLVGKLIEFHLVIWGKVKFGKRISQHYACPLKTKDSLGLGKRGK
jgi:hypothetical protein